MWYYKHIQMNLQLFYTYSSLEFLFRVALHLGSIHTVFSVYIGDVHQEMLQKYILNWPNVSF